MVGKIILVVPLALGNFVPGHASDSAAHACARNVFEKHVAKHAETQAGRDSFLEYLHIRGLDEFQFASGVRFYETQWTLERPSLRALIAVSSDSCNLLAGDLDELLGVAIPMEDRWGYSTVQYNNVVGGGVLVANTDDAVIEYGYSVVSLLDPYVRIHKTPRTELLRSLGAVAELSKEGKSKCNKSEKWRRNAYSDVMERFVEPSASSGEGVRVVRFCTWLAVGGTVRLHTVYILDGGKVSISTDTLATHIGPHEDAPFRNSLQE